AENLVRHRTVVRDARCVPSAMDRDERGLIRAIHEFMNAGPDADFEAHAIGSSFDQTKKTVIINAGWVKDIDYSNVHQQTVTCVRGEAMAAPRLAQVTSVIVAPLEDPLADPRAQRRRSTTVYEYDALSQLTGVHLPNPRASAANAPINPGSKVIRVAYDGLGRRLATDDPDRGFEYLAYDLASNLVCHRSGPTAGDEAGFASALNQFGLERARVGSGGADHRLVGEDVCLEPEGSARNRVSRVVRNEYLYDRLSRVIYRVPPPLEGGRKTVSIEYGRADDRSNRAGRQIKLTDVTGTI